MGVSFRLLGPLEVADADDRPIELGGRQPRIMLAVLVAAAPRPVTVESIIDAVWGDAPPATATGTLQSYVSRLRRRLGTDRLRFEEGSYRLDVEDAELDFKRFEALADRGRAQLEAGALDEARTALVDAEALWRGPALAEFAESDFARGIAVRLDERRLVAIEDRFDAELGLGRHAAIVGELTESVERHPLRERLQGQLALALYRSGRQAESLRALADAGSTLRDELGIEPSVALRELEAAILNQDEQLLSTPSPSGPPAPARAASQPPRAGSAAPSRRAGMPYSLVGRATELDELTDAW